MLDGVLRNLRKKLNKTKRFGAFKCTLRGIGRRMTQAVRGVFISPSPWKCLPECEAVFVLSGPCDYCLPERSSPMLTLLPHLVPARPMLEYYKNM